MSSISHCRRCAASSADKKSAGEAPIKACAGVSRLAAAALLTRMKRPLSSCTVRPIESASTMSLRNVQSCSASRAFRCPSSTCRRHRSASAASALPWRAAIAAKATTAHWRAKATSPSSNSALPASRRSSSRARRPRTPIGRQSADAPAGMRSAGKDCPASLPRVPLMARTPPRSTSMKKGSRGQRAPIAPLGAAAMQTSASASSARTTA